MRFPLTTALAALTLTATSNAIPTIAAKGSKFFTSDGKQWYIKGVAYQPTGNDPLADPVQCALDAPLMQKLGANAIRIYHADPYANHDACMATFAAAGIYVFADLDTYNTALVESLTPVWTATQFANFSRVMDAFSSYSNMAGFLIGNEVLNIPGPLTVTAPFIKAATADLKAYRDSKGYRPIPVGYAHADVGGLRPALPEYLACGSDFAQSIDFFALNSYLFCGNMTYPQSGYMALYEQTQNYTVPIFMSETGCNVPEPRYWLDENSLFGPMADVWSGSIIYDWVQQDNHYGIITYGGGNTDALDYNAPPGGFLASGTPTPITPDFGNLLNVWATNTPTGIAAAAYTPPLTTLACPAYTAGIWEVVGNPLPLPTLGVSALKPFIAAATSTPSTASSIVLTIPTAPPPTLSTTVVVTTSVTPNPATSSPADPSIPVPAVAPLGGAAAVSAVTPSAFGANAILASTSSSATSESYSLVISSMVPTAAPATSSPVNSTVSPSSTSTSTTLMSSASSNSLSSASNVSSIVTTSTVLSTSTTTMLLSSSSSAPNPPASADAPPYVSNTTTTASVVVSSSTIVSTTTSIVSTAVSSTSATGPTSSTVIAPLPISASTTATTPESSIVPPTLSSSFVSISTTTLTTSTLSTSPTSTLSNSSVASSPTSRPSASSSSTMIVSGQSSTMSVQVVSSVVFSTTTPSVSRSTVVVAPSAAASTSRAIATGSAVRACADGSLGLLCGGLVLGLIYLGV